MTTAEILIQQVLFLACASDSEVHPDVAVRELEGIVHAIRSLPSSERQFVLREIDRREASSRASTELDALADLRESILD